jgi:uncharacterized membrane protein (DUF2068 family)
MSRKIRIPLQTLAVYEAAKGLLVLLVGAGVMSWIHSHSQVEGADIVRFFHLNPARHIPDVFLKTLANLSSTTLWLLSFSAILYSVIRFLEAYGLWRNKIWAIWFSVASNVLFIPMELLELIERFSLSRFALFIANIILVLYLVRFAKKVPSEI